MEEYKDGGMIGFDLTEAIKGATGAKGDPPGPTGPLGAPGSGYKDRGTHLWYSERSVFMSYNLANLCDHGSRPIAPAQMGDDQSLANFAWNVLADHKDHMIKVDNGDFVCIPYNQYMQVLLSLKNIEKGIFYELY